jgi:hypothetical protein
MTKQLDCLPFGSAGYNKIFSRALEGKKNHPAMAGKGNRSIHTFPQSVTTEGVA